MKTTYIIYKDGQEVKKFENETDDFKPFKWLLNNQGQSTNYALKHGGYKVKEIHEDGTETYWKPYA